MSEVFVKIKNQQLGPYTSSEIKSLISDGKFKENDFIFDNDSQEWVKANQYENTRGIFQSDQAPQKTKTVFAIGGGKGGVGKTSLAASIGISLAALGYEVVIVDADLGGANLHTCMGILEPEYTFYDFYTLRRDSLKDILLNTSIENLKLISGACGTLGLANPRYSQKLRFIAELKSINADFILLDLGAGSSFNVIDFFIAADIGIAVTTPEPMAIQETFNFIKISLFRKILRKFSRTPQVYDVIEQFAQSERGRLHFSMEQVIAEVKKINTIAANDLEGVLDSFNPKLILNMVHSAGETKEGAALKTAVEELLSVNLDYLGYIDYDDSVRMAVKELKPFIISNPGSKASRSLAQLVSAGLLGNKGLKGFREKKRVLRQIKAGASEYPGHNLNESDTICSVKCFYWDDCEYQNGGHPCPVRHLDPIFKH